MEKVWACYDCGIRVLWSYENMVNRGSPICYKCDVEMCITNEVPLGYKKFRIYIIYSKCVNKTIEVNELRARVGDCSENIKKRVALLNSCFKGFRKGENVKYWYEETEVLVKENP